MQHAHTHTHTHTYIYIYIYIMDSSIDLDVWEANSSSHLSQCHMTFQTSYRLEWFVIGEASDSTATVLWATDSRICSKQHAVSLCSFYLAFYLCFIRVKVVQSNSSIDMATAWKNPCFILSYSYFHMVVNLSI